MGEPRVPPLNRSETIVLSEHYRLFKFGGIFHNGGTRGTPIMPRDVSLSDSKCWNGWHEWVKSNQIWNDLTNFRIYFSVFIYIFFPH